MQLRLACFAVLIGCAVSSTCCNGQMIHSSTPMQQFGSGFFEQSGVHWSINGPNFFANSGAGVLPPFGNADPNSGLRTGFGFGGGGVSGSLGFNFSQGSSRTITSTTPSITTMDGYPGSINSGTVRPFVTGVTPVVGGFSYGQPARDNVSNRMFQAAQQTQATEQQQRAQANLAAKQAKAAEAFNRGVDAEAEGNLRKARANYRRALAAAQGPLRQQIIQRMNARGWK